MFITLTLTAILLWTSSFPKLHQMISLQPNGSIIKSTFLFTFDFWEENTWASVRLELISSTYKAIVKTSSYSRFLIFFKFLIFLIFVFPVQLTINKKCSIQILPMTGFEPRTSGIRSKRSTDLATTTAQLFSSSQWSQSVPTTWTIPT